MEQLEESEIIGFIMASLEGAEVAKIVSIAFFALFSALSPFSLILCCSLQLVYEVHTQLITLKLSY